MHKDLQNRKSLCDPAIINVSEGTITLSGDWSCHFIDENIIKDSKLDLNIKFVDASAIGRMDTTGAFFIAKLIMALNDKQSQPQIKLSSKHKTLYELVTENLSFEVEHKDDFTTFDTAYRIGFRTTRYVHDFVQLLGFLGEITDSSLRIIRTPWKVRWRLIMDIVYSTGYQAIGIICLLAFLIGVVLAYQMGGQLLTYGANIFIVNLLGISLLREFAPLITSIIVAGRSGSAFAAQIGTMKVQEELDALRTFGIPPIGRLVLPRIVGLLIALPLLVVLADIASIAGGMIMSKAYLGLSYTEFLTQFGNSISFNTYMVGLVKTPVFALIIAAVGCYRGLCVKGDAASIGEETTKSVVYSIFLIIIADATFSILFSMAGL